MLNYFLGVEVTYNVIVMHLSRHISMKELLDMAGLLNAKPLATPMSSGKLLSKVDGHVLVEPYKYRWLVGSL